MYTMSQNKLANGCILRERYKIIKLISDNSGFGITYLAEDLDLPDNHKCVVKQLNLQKFSNPTVIDKVTEGFQRESESLYKLGKHPQIPRLFARFQEEGEFYIVQEYIDGYSLCREINSDKLWTETQTIKFLAEILEILAFVHQNSSIHRDIKPSNIMRREQDKKLFLIDFGAVKKIHTSIDTPQGSANQNPFPTIIGTRPYASPEQMCMIDPKTVYANDIFAVGIIAIQGLTGSTEHDNWRNNNTEIEVSNNLGNIIDKMVHKECEKRYKNASEALGAVNQTIILPPPGPNFTQATLWEKFKKWW